MSNSSKTILIQANLALRNGDFKSAIALYNEAILLAKDPSIRDQIRFNLNLALRRFDKYSFSKSQIEAQNATGEIGRAHV